MRNIRKMKLLSCVMAAAVALSLYGGNGVVVKATEPQAEETPATEAPATEAPATEAPATEKATTEAKAKTKKTTESKKSEKKTKEKSTEASTQTTVPDNGVSDASVLKAREDIQNARTARKEAENILKNLKTTKNDLQRYVNQIDTSINELQIETTHLEATQKELEGTIEVTTKQLEDAKKAQQSQYDSMKTRIQMVYESGNKRYLDILLSAASMTDMLNKTEYVSQVSLYDYNILKQLKNAKELVANLKQKLESDLKNNEELQREIAAQRKTMEQISEEKKAQIEQYNISIASQEAEVQKYMQAEAEAENIILAAEQAATNYSTTTQYTGGQFTWPVPGYYEISSYFGVRTSPVAGASTNHKGIDIKCDTGVPVVAAADGTVIVATYNYAEGNYVVIDHGGGVVTLYMHNSSLNVSVGESVAAGQQIACAGSTGVSTGPHCHFGVRVNGTYVDPLTYLQ
ncbi:MAG: peptidoglycan DD-metalloendopeptidase family protein [Lachnospiraceae bacterium]|nr:peptidoglycan DD-metalloendopeptidase family protein [Lachnospiraceae bacterium]